METETERSNDKLTISQPGVKSLQKWIVDQVTILAEAMGEPMTAARLRIYAQELADIEQGQLAIAFQRAMRELRFFPKIAELRELAGESAKEQQDAEARAAWDTATRFADKHVQSDCASGSYEIVGGPPLPQRILDCVRRTGGWRAYKCLTPADYPFQQKRFLEEYQAWDAVQRCFQADRMLADAGLMDSLRQLSAGKAMSQ